MSVHISDSPLVFIPLALAGDSPERRAFLFVPESRDRDQRFAFAAGLAAILVPYIETSDAPQLLVPNPSGVAFTRLLGRSLAAGCPFSQNDMRYHLRVSCSP